MRVLIPLIALSLQAAPPELALPDMVPIGARVWVAPLGPGAWVTTFTHGMGKDGEIPANGLILEKDGACVLVDPGWEPAQTAS